jgi:predicted acetyltransferase
MAGELTLEKPHAQLEESYRAMVREYNELGERLVPFPLAFPHEDFSAYLAQVVACERGEGIAQGFVPHSTYWLVRDGSEVVGISNLRHRLTDSLREEGGNIGYGIRPSARRRGYATQILRQTCARARALGLSEVLVTCARANVGSARAILRCGGVLRSEAYLPARGEILQRYVITL